MDTFSRAHPTRSSPSCWQTRRKRDLGAGQATLIILGGVGPDIFMSDSANRTWRDLVALTYAKEGYPHKFGSNLRLRAMVTQKQKG